MRRFIAVVSSCLFMFSGSTMALGQADIAFKGIGGRLGFVMPESNIGNTIGFGIQADLGTITRDIHLGALADFWTKSYDHGDAESSLTQIVLGATARYLFEIRTKVIPYAGGGLGFTIGHSSGDEHSDSDFDLGLHLLGGVEYSLSRSLKGLAELKYHIDGADYLGIWIGVTCLLAK